MKKVCYILPKYDISTESHFYHIYELLESASKILNISLIIENAKQYPNNKNFKSIYVQKFKFLPIRVIELFLVSLYFRLKGYKKFYTHYSYIGAICTSIITKLLGGKTYYWHCGMKGDFMCKWQLNFKTIKTKILDDYMFLLTLKLIDYLVTGTDSMAKYYSETFGIKREKIKVMPNWIDLNRFNPEIYDKESLKKELDIEQNRQVVLFVHRLAERKGAQYLVKIAKEVIKEVPDVIFMIVGGGPYKTKLECEIKRNNLENEIRIIGNIPNREIPKYYSIADILIMPSDEEGFPRILIEAMSMGIPFIATDVGGVMDITTRKQQNFIISKGNVKKFAENVSLLLKDSHTRKELEEEGFKQVKKYTKEKAVQRFIKIIL